MTGLLFVLACRPTPPTVDTATSSPPLPAAERILLTDDRAVTLDPAYCAFGTALAAGSDLDHDGVLEWAASAPCSGLWHDRVVVFEGTTPVAERTANPDAETDDPVGDFGEYLAAGGDTDGDGFGELLITDWRPYALPRTWLLRSVDRGDDVWIHDVDERRFDRQEPSFARTEAGWAAVVVTDLGVDWRVDRLAEPVLADGVELGPDTLVYQKAADESGSLGEVVVVDGNGDALDEFVLPRTHETGVVYLCPLQAAIDRDRDCDIVAEDAEIGRWQAIGDFDGDGQPELATAGAPDGGEDGSLSVYDLSGERVARIAGTHGAMFGAYPEVLVDDAGDRWLLVADRRFGEEGRVYAFHGRQLVGDLVDDDALRIYTTGAPGYLRLPTPYRATPEGPLQLLISDPTHGGGKVWVMDW